MGTPKKSKKPVVWQDVMPAQQVRKNKKKKMRIKVARIVILMKQVYKKIAKKVSTIRHRKLFILAVVGIIILLAVGLYYLFFVAHPSSSNPLTPIQPVLERGTPNYSTILPGGETADSLGGWTRISPPDRNPVFAYVDKIGDVSITVSEQPLPDNFKTDTEQQVELLADDFNAKEKISVNGLVVHIGSSEDGPQSVIFNKNKLLVLIKSSSRISNDDWIKYINTLS